MQLRTAHFEFDDATHAAIIGQRQCTRTAAKDVAGRAVENGEARVCGMSRRNTSPMTRSDGPQTRPLRAGLRLRNGYVNRTIVL